MVLVLTAQLLRLLQTVLNAVDPLLQSGRQIHAACPAMHLGCRARRSTLDAGFPQGSTTASAKLARREVLSMTMATQNVGSDAGGCARSCRIACSCSRRWL